MYLYFCRYGREYPDPYLSHGIGPVPGYQVIFLKFYILFWFHNKKYFSF